MNNKMMMILGVSTMFLSTTVAHAQMYENVTMDTTNQAVAIDIYDAKVNEFMNIFNTKVSQKSWGPAEIKTFIAQLDKLAMNKTNYRDYIQAISSRISMDYQWILGSEVVSTDPMIKDFIQILNNITQQDLSKDEIVSNLVTNITNRLNGVPNMKAAVATMNSLLKNYAEQANTSKVMKEAIPEVIKQTEALLANTSRSELTDINNQLNNANIRSPYYPANAVTKLTTPEFTADPGYTVAFGTTYVNASKIGADVESEYIMRGPNNKLIDLKTIVTDNPDKYTIAVVTVAIKNNSTKATNYPDNIQLVVKDSNNMIHNTMNVRTATPQMQFEAGESYLFKRYFLLDKGATIKKTSLSANDWPGKVYTY